MDEGELVDLHEGMKVSNEAGDELGTLSALLIPEDEEEAEFLILKGGNAERLVPFEAVLGVGDGVLILDASREALTRYPAVGSNADPTDEDCEKAYDVYDETGEYAGEEDDE